MNRRDALKLLSARAADDRLRAARALARTGDIEDTPTIRAALAREPNRWVKGALRKALITISGPAAPAPIEIGTEGEEERVIEQIHATAVEETTQQIIHELRPVLGRLSLYAAEEIPDYDKSKTKVEASRLKDLLAAIDKLNKAASAPIYSEFDLAALLDQIITSETAKGVAVQRAGTKPLVILGASDFVNLIIGNALRNAVEATQAVGSTEPITVTWNTTDRDHSIAVIDSGIGLPDGCHKIFEMGATTKKGHLGMGLALAKQAALSLNGKITLTPTQTGGTRFEFRWPHASL